MKRAWKWKIKIIDNKWGRLPLGVVDEEDEEFGEDGEELGRRTLRMQVR